MCSLYTNRQHSLSQLLEECAIESSIFIVVQLLLYAEERAQADTFIADGTLPSVVYGAEHLLRLFVKLPEYLPVAGSTEEQYRLLQDQLHSVLDFMQSKLTEFFVPPAEYLTPMQE